MRSNKRVYLFLALFLLLTACGSPHKDTPSGSGVSITVTGDNALPLTVNGSPCSSTAYLNEPCVSVTVCDPGNPSSCQTINDILLDTGDTGLRVFKQVFNPALLGSLTPITATNGDPIADCVQYADGSANWGPVETASVVLANEPAVTVPIQVIDSTFANGQKVCQNPNTTPAVSMFNGSLGMAFWLQDCGQDCADGTNKIQYFSCNGSNCSSEQVSLTDQVQNPVALLPQDNNGVLLVLPSVPSGGALYASGALVLGIDTQPNNSSSGATVYDADQFGEFTTSLTINNKVYTYSSFIDSGSNGLFFPPSGFPLPNCSSPNYSGWYCPSSTQNLLAAATGASGLPNPPNKIAFQIGNFASLLNSPNWVFANIGGDTGSNSGPFDWGLPFFFGRKVYIGFEGQQSPSLGATGPYWAF